MEGLEAGSLEERMAHINFGLVAVRLPAPHMKCWPSICTFHSSTHSTSSQLLNCRCADLLLLSPRRSANIDLTCCNVELQYICTFVQIPSGCHGVLVLCGVVQDDDCICRSSIAPAAKCFCISTEHVDCRRRQRVSARTAGISAAPTKRSRGDAGLPLGVGQNTRGSQRSQ